MESRAWGANRLRTALKAKHVIGTAPRRSDRCAIGVVSVQRLEWWWYLLCGSAPLKGSLVSPHAPGHAGEFVGQCDGGDVVSLASLKLERPGSQIVRHLCDAACP